MSFVDLLSGSLPLLLLSSLLLGLIVGSFLNVLIYRLPLMLQREWLQECRELLESETGASLSAPLPQAAFRRFDLASPGSHCPACRQPLSAAENIPLLSWLWQRGRCRHCQVAISPRYPLVEAGTALVTALLAWRFGVGWGTLALFVLGWGLIALTLIDLDHHLLPDDLTLPLLWLGLIVNALGQGPANLEDAVWGAVTGYGLLWSVYWIFRLLTGKEGMGQGDFKLLAALGAWLGWQALPLIILVSSLLGALLGLSLIALQGRSRHVALPFGPYLAAAGGIALFWGEELTALYLAWAASHAL